MRHARACTTVHCDFKKYRIHMLAMLETVRKLMDVTYKSSRGANWLELQSLYHLSYWQPPLSSSGVAGIISVQSYMMIRVLTPVARFDTISFLNGLQCVWRLDDYIPAKSDNQQTSLSALVSALKYASNSDTRPCLLGCCSFH